MAQLKDLLVSGAARFLNGLNINGDLTIAGNLLPAKNETYNLGDSSHRWRQTQTKYLSVGAGDISGSGYEAVISGDLHTTGYSLFDDYVQVGGARDNSAYKFYVNGKTHLKGDTRITGNLLMTTGSSSICWDEGTYRQKILTTDDSTANTAVFTFQQSENTGSSWKNLLEVRDNGRLILTNKTGGIYRVDDAATSAPLIHLSNNNVDSSIIRIDGNNRTSVVDTQSYGFDLKYIGTGGGEANSLDLIADNMDGANVTAISVSNNGKIGIGDKFNTNYRFYVSGNSYHSNTINFAENTTAINFRPGGGSYYTTMSYQTTGNEALVFATKQAVTSFMFVNGEDSVTNHASDRWTVLSPTLQIKNKSVYVNSLIANGTNPSYNFYVNGTSYFNGNTTHNGIDYFANGTTYYINNSADAKLRYLALGGLDPTSSYQLYVNGQSWIKGTLWTRHLYPEANNAYDLGSTSYRWRDMYGTAKDAAHASYTTTAETETYILVKINSAQIYWMSAFTLRVYQSYEYYDVVISGYQYGNNYWYSPKAVLSASTSSITSLKVYFGYNSTTEMWVAVPGASYTGARILNAVNGYKPLDMTKAFSISRVATLPGTTQSTQTVYRPWYRNETVNNAETATKFASSQSITLTGDTTGTASSQAGWSIGTNTYKLSNAGHLDTVEKLNNFIEGNKLKYATVASIGGVASDGMIISVPWSSSSWGHQVFLDDSAMVMQHRHRYTKTNDDGSKVQAWSGWATLLDSNNYTTYTVTQTGGGASGTWGISITGSAATAIALTTSAGSTGQPVYFNSGKPVAIDWHIGNSGVGEHNANNVTYNFCGYYTSNGPATSIGASTTDGALYAQAYSSSWVGQIAQDYRNGGLYVRGKNNGTWQSWYSVLDTRNYTSILDSRYVNATGDTITGELYVDGGTTLASLLVKGDARFVNTIQGNLSGNASTATKLATARTISLTGDITGSGTFDGSGNLSISTTANHSHDSIYVKKSGDTMTGNLTVPSIFTSNWFRSTGSTGWYNETYGGGWYQTDTTYIRTHGSFQVYSPGRFLAGDTPSSWIDGLKNGAAYRIEACNDTGAYHPWIQQTNNSSGYCFSMGILDTTFYIIGCPTSQTANNYTASLTFNMANGYLQGCSRVYNAVWNDYAEFRKANTIEPGKVVIEGKFGIMLKSTSRLQPGGSIISDTYGTAMGETDECKTPIAVAGRVLAYTYEEIDEYEIGDVVCTGPNGTVSKMTREEIREYPDRIIGSVSEIPDYETWGTGNVKVDGRIWIKVR